MRMARLQVLKSNDPCEIVFSPENVELEKDLTTSDVTVILLTDPSQVYELNMVYEDAITELDCAINFCVGDVVDR